MGLRGGYRIPLDGRWLVMVALLGVFLAPLVFSRLQPPPAPGDKTLHSGNSWMRRDTHPAALRVYDEEKPCLNAGQMYRAGEALFASDPRPDPDRWLHAINAALYDLRADCLDEDFLLLVVSIIQMESGVRADPPLAEPDLETLFVRRKEQLASENLLAAGLLSVSTMEDDLRRKLRQDTLRGRVRTERDLARYTDADLRPWLRDYLQRTFLMPEALAARAEARWLPDPVKTIGPMQVNSAKAFQNAKARGDGVQSLEAMRAILLDPETALTRGIEEGVALLLKGYRVYRAQLDAEDSVYYAGADYNAGEFSCRNSAYQEMLAEITGQRLSYDGDLLLYTAGDASDVPSRSEVAARQAVPKLSAAQVRRDLLLEKEPGFSDTETARGICARYREVTRKGCLFARMPTGAGNPKADLKLGRTYTPENYANGLFAKYRRNRERYQNAFFGL